MMELTTTTEILSLFETNKAQRQDFISKTIEAIEEGGANPLKVHLQIKAAEDIIKGLTSNEKYRNLILDEASKNGKAFELYNAKFSIKETGSKYDYAQCGDNELEQMQAQMDALSEKIKARQKFLQNIPESGLAEVNEETGDVNTLYRPTKSSTTSVTVQLT